MKYWYCLKAKLCLLLQYQATLLIFREHNLDSVNRSIPCSAI